jgi:predicted DNA-binding ribbon-helix-helix protein
MRRAEPLATFRAYFDSKLISVTRCMMIRRDWGGSRHRRQAPVRAFKGDAGISEANAGVHWPEKPVPAPTKTLSELGELVGGDMKSPVVKRSIVIAGHKTSVSLEDAFWKGLKEIALGRDITLSAMVAAIDSGRAQGNLSSALRLFVLDHYRTMIGSAEGTRSSHVETAEQSPPTVPDGR